MGAIKNRERYTAEEIAYTLGGQKKSGNGWLCRCPAHDDKSPSLSLNDTEDGKLLYKCFAGCSQEAVGEELASRDLYPRKSRVLSFPANKDRFLNVGETLSGLPIVARYDYRLEDGSLIFSKYILKSKDGGKTFRILPAKKKPALYNLPDIKRARENGFTVYLCEGEKDADRITSLGWIATTPPHGAGKWKDQYTAALKGLDVVIFADHDKVGEEEAAKIAGMISKDVASVKVVCFPELPEKGDVSEYLDDYSKNALESKITSTPVYVKPSDIKEFELSEFGNGQRFAHFTQGRVKYCTNTKEYLAFNGQRWAKDSVVVERFAKDVINLIPGEAIFHTTEKQQKDLERHVAKSKKWSGVVGTLNTARSEDGMQVEFEQLDRHPSISKPLLNVNNGTIDLKTGDLLPHSKDDYITTISSMDYNPKATAPRWNQFLQEVFEGDKELIEWLQCFLGYVLTGETCLRLFAILHGSGRNGKSTLVETIAKVLGGDYAKGVPTKTLYASKYESDTNPEIARLVGARFVYASEGKENEVLNTSLVKRFSGDENIVVRALYKEPIEFQPQFTVFLSTNHKPRIDDTTNSIWDRTRLIPFNRRFDDSEVDPSLRKTLLEEQSGILTWLVEGAVCFYQMGMKLPDCQAITDATQSYRADSDRIQSFLAEACSHNREVRVGVGDLHNAFNKWCEQEDGNSLHLITFRKKMLEKGYKIDPGGGGKKFFRGLEIKDNTLEVT